MSVNTDELVDAIVAELKKSPEFPDYSNEENFDCHGATLSFGHSTELLNGTDPDISIYVLYASCMYRPPVCRVEVKVKGARENITEMHMTQASVMMDIVIRAGRKFYNNFFDHISHTSEGPIHNFTTGHSRFTTEYKVSATDVKCLMNIMKCYSFVSNDMYFSDRTSYKYYFDNYSYGCFHCNNASGKVKFTSVQRGTSNVFVNFSNALSRRNIAYEYCPGETQSHHKIIFDKVHLHTAMDLFSRMYNCDTEFD